MPRRVPPTSAYRLWVQRSIWLLAWLACRLMRVDVRGCPPVAPCIIVSNHLHYLDIPLAGRHAVRLGERVHWLAKTELFAIPLIGAVLRGRQTVAVNRGTADRQALEAIAAYAQTDKVWIFPEGHRSETGRLQAGKEGTVLVARRAGVPLVPVAISGTEAGLLPLLLRRKTLRLRLGEPFTLPRRVRRDEGIAIVMARIADLLPPEHRPA